MVTALVQKEEIIEQKKVRYLCIDVFRGITIIAMVFVNTLAEFQNTPSWSKHAPDFGLTYVDLVAPFFIFAIALTYKMSFDRYVEKDGKVKTYTRFLRRYAALIGFQFLGSISNISINGITFSWGVLQAIGLAGIFTLFFIHMPKQIRFMVSLCLLGIYQNIAGLNIIIDSTPITISDWIFNDRHNGFVGGFVWGAMMLLSTAIIDDFRKKDMNEILIWGIIFSGVGTAFHLIWREIGNPIYLGISKERVSPAYVLLSVGLAAILFWITWFVMDKKHLSKDKSYITQPYGKNAFFCYIIHPLFVLLSTLYLKDDALVALVFLSGFLNVLLLWGVAFWLARKEIYIII